MIEEPPDPKEVSHYHFIQLRTLKLVQHGEQSASKSLNVIAAASKYGLLFVGISSGFKVLKFENILDVDEDKENKNLEENYYNQMVSSETPISLSLSADQKTLAVCVCRGTATVADMYDIGVFADPDELPVAFQSVLLSEKNGCKLKEFVWNPVSEGMYSYCLSDGSLHVHTITGTVSTVVASVLKASATAVSWSPKGKQLVVGKSDGSLTQYKPTLVEVKTIPAPNFSEKLTVATTCWISTAQFAVLYVSAEGASPYLFLISTPKGSPIVYSNFYDVCLGNSSSADQRYFLHHEPTWGILICASTDSIEVAVLGEPPSWVQWELRDDGRVLLPAKDGAKHAISMGVMYCSQRRIIINENESYPPMPVIFFLTDNGLLLPYYMVNSASGSVSLVRPSTPIERKQRRPEVNQNFAESGFISKPFQNASKVPNVISRTSEVAAFQTNTLGSANSFSFGEPPAFGIGESATRQGSSNIDAPFQASSAPQTFEMERFHKPSKGLSASNPVPARDGVRHMAVAQRSASLTRNESEKAFQFDSSVPALGLLKSAQSGSGDDSLVSNQDTYQIALLEEIHTFDKEIEELKKSSSYLGSIGTKEEMTNLKNFTMKFEEFQTEMSETMMSLNSDIHSLKNILLESFVMIEEANSRERRKNDNVYLCMLRDRALDPITAKNMQKIERNYLYLSTQLQEVSNKLDQEWFEYLEKRKENQRAARLVSSTEAIYKTVVNNRGIIHNLQTRIDHISKSVTEKKLDNLSRRRYNTQINRRSDPEELSKLADAFLQAKITTSDEEKAKPIKKIPVNAQTILKKYLTSSTVSSLRPTIVYSPSQSRLISKSLLFSKKNESAINSVVLPEVGKIHAETPASELEGLRLRERISTSHEQNNIERSKELGKASVTKLIPPTSNVTTGKALTLTDEIVSPVYEDITPPDSPRLTTFSSQAPSSDARIMPLIQSSSPLVLQAKKSEVPELFKSQVSADQSDSKVNGSSAANSGCASSPPITKIQGNFADNFKTTLNTSNEPTVGKSSTVFSFLPSLSDSKKQESKLMSPPPINFTEGSVFDTSKILNPTIPHLFAQNSNKMQVKEATSFIASSTVYQKSSLSNILNPKSSSEVPTLNPALQSLETAETKTSIDFGLASNKMPVAPKEFSFFGADMGTTLSQVLPVSLEATKTSSSNLLTTVSISSQDTDSSLKLTDSAKETFIPAGLKMASSENISQAVSNQIPIVLPQNPVLTASSTPKAASASPVITQKPELSAPLPLLTSGDKKDSEVEITATTEIPLALDKIGPTSVLPPPNMTLPLQKSSNSALFNQQTSMEGFTKPVKESTVSTISSSEVQQANILVSASSTSSSSIFGQASISSAPFGQTIPPTSIPTTSTAFDQTTSSFFGPATTTQSSFFGKSVSDTIPFGQSTIAQTSHFGAIPSTSSTSQGSFFSQPSTTSAPIFGGSNSTSGFTSQAGGGAFSFGMSPFGQSQSSFGLAKAVFGQTTSTFQTENSPSATFGQAAGGGNVFGQGPFFSGLGAPPSAENASKNVFAVGNLGKPNSESNVFGSSAFGAKPASPLSGGSFSTGGGSVAQSGFGSFQQSPQKTGGFGAPPAFGGAPAFGTPPSFSGGGALGSIFGSQTENANFSSFASANAPTFGSLASQGPSSFGSPQQSFGQQQFGSVFGGGFAAQPQSFGNASTAPGNSSAFTQWRN